MRSFLADAALVHPTKTHPRTGEPLRALGVTKRGHIMWPILGASSDDDGNSGTDRSTGTDGDTDAAGGGNQGGTGDAADADLGYPANTPVAEMTDKQQAAYFKRVARKHEDRVKALKPAADKAKKWDEHQAANQTEQEKAIAQAKADARTEALTEAGTKLVESYVRAAVKSNLDADKAKTIAAGINAQNFLGENMLPDEDKIDAYLSALLPANAGTGSGPDMGQGRRTSGKPTGVAAGAAEYEAKRARRAGAITAANNT